MLSIFFVNQSEKCHSVLEKFVKKGVHGKNILNFLKKLKSFLKNIDDAINIVYNHYIDICRISLTNVNIYLTVDMIY